MGPLWRRCPTQRQPHTHPPLNPRLQQWSHSSSGQSPAQAWKKATAGLNLILNHPWGVYCKIYPNWGCLTPYCKWFELAHPGFLNSTLLPPPFPVLCLSALYSSPSLFCLSVYPPLTSPLGDDLSLFYSPNPPNKPLTLTLLFLVCSLSGIPW